MILQIDWGNPTLQENDVLQVQPTDLDDFYVSASDFDKTNIFFILLNSYHKYLCEEKKDLAAHISFLMANYLFITLTPPGSCELAMHYIKQAIFLNPLPLYYEWLSLIEKGN